VVFIFIVGTLVELALELTLSASGIRQEQQTWSISLFLINTLIEFNLGIVIMYLIYCIFKIKRYDHYYLQLGLKDLKFIKTNFDAIASICQNNGLKKNRLKAYSKLYSINDFLSDLNYYCTNYKEPDKINLIESEIKSLWKNE
jgi:hypothetical protein